MEERSSSRAPSQHGSQHTRAQAHVGCTHVHASTQTLTPSDCQERGVDQVGDAAVGSALPQQPC